MSRDLLDLVRELNTLNDDNLADRVIENSDVQRCLSELQDILEEAPTLTPPNEWVSVEERLPEEKQRVIVRCERVGTSVGWILWGNWMTDIGPDAGKVTHWMPLPAPPDRRPPERQEDNNETD